LATREKVEGVRAKTRKEKSGKRAQLEPGWDGEKGGEGENTKVRDNNRDLTISDTATL
jgi:hypothetical protein